MADVTISQLTQGTPNNDALIPYSQGGSTLAVAPSALLVNACTQNPGNPNFGNGVGINSSSARVPLEVANRNGWPYNIYVSGTAPNIYFGQNVGKFPNPGSGNTYIPDPLVDSSGPAAAFIGFSTATGNYGTSLGDLNICTQSSSANNSNAINFMTPLDDTNGFKVSMKINKQGYVTTPYQPIFRASMTGGGGNHGNTLIKVPFNYAPVNVGGHYNLTDKQFNVPIAGNYYFTAGHMNSQNNSGHGTIEIRKNNVRQCYFHNSNVHPMSTSHSIIMQCSQGDYIDMWASNYHFGGAAELGYDYPTLMGYLIG